QEALELFVGAVELVDEKDGRFHLRGVDRAKKGSSEKKCFAEDVGKARLVRAPGRDREQLAGIVPLVDRLAEVQSFVALKADELGIQDFREDAREIRLPDAGGPLEKERAPHFDG